MTRRSKRSIEKSLDELDDGTNRSSNTTLLDAYSEDVVKALRAAYRDLHRVIWDHPDTIANAPDSEATERFLVVVRERYGIDQDRDDDVQRALGELLAESWQRTPCQLFIDISLNFAVKFDITTSDSRTVTDLIHAGREEELVDLLAVRTYATLADHGGHRTEVPA